MNISKANILKSFVVHGIYEDEMESALAEESVNSIYRIIDMQTDKRPNEIDERITDNGYISVTGECPVCWNKVRIANNYCSVCGQKLDWAEQREELKRTRGYSYV